MSATIGFRRHQRIDGTWCLAGRADQDVVIPAGAVLDLRRTHDPDGPEFVLVIAPARTMTRKEAAAASLDNMPRATRIDPRELAGMTPSPPAED